MAFLDASTILAVDDYAQKTVPVPEWGGEVIIKAMNGTERDDFEASVRPKGIVDLTNYRSKLLVRVLVNENGTRIFRDVDAGALGKRSAKVIDRLFDVASRMSALNEEAAEDAEGNSGEPKAETDGSDSPSSSPESSDAPAQSS